MMLPYLIIKHGEIVRVLMIPVIELIRTKRLLLVKVVSMMELHYLINFRKDG